MHGHHSHHHRQPAPIRSQQPVKHHYGSGNNTAKVLAILVICLIVNLFWYFSGAQHP